MYPFRGCRFNYNLSASQKWVQIDVAGGGCNSRQSSVSSLGSRLGGGCRDSSILSPECAVLLLTLNQVGFGDTVQSQMLLVCASEQPPPWMILGELPNSLQDKKQIQLFHPESEERTCKIKVKNIALKLCFPCGFSSLAAEVTPILDLQGISEMGTCIRLRITEKIELAKTCRCSWGQGTGKTALFSLTGSGRRNLACLSGWCWPQGPQTPKHPSAICLEPHWPCRHGVLWGQAQLSSAVPYGVSCHHCPKADFENSDKFHEKNQLM